MIEITNIDIYGFKAAIRGMRNPLNSWDNSDSWFYDRYVENLVDINGKEYDGGIPDHNDDIFIGENDLKLMKKLVNAGSDHRKFMRMINVTMDICAPLYWWKEFDTYKVATVRNSCSTMHKIQAKEFEIGDFSSEHLLAWDEVKWGDILPIEVLDQIIRCLNEYRKKFLETNDKKYWWQMIQLLPSSYNQKATVQLSYETLRSMYHSRKNHKLDEWKDFCKMIEKDLPHSELVTM